MILASRLRAASRGEKPPRLRAVPALGALLALVALSSPLRWVDAAQPDRILSFDGNTGWINSAPLTPDELRGKVVLVDFWEYTCINCLRTLPYLREWYRRYHDLGFVIVGVHTPEFRFSGERANVTAAAERLHVSWPIVLDGDYTIWKRYGNYVWPHEYLYDQEGRLVENVDGEGLYQQTEAGIQELLKLADPKLALPPIMALLPEDSYDKPGAVCYPKTDEVIIRRQGIGNAAGSQSPLQDTNYAYTTSDPKDGEVYLQGYWRLTRAAAVSGESNGYIVLRYHAIELVAVMRPESGGSIRVDVTQDGHPVAKSDAGTDLRYDDRGNSYVAVDAPRAYDLVVNARFGTHTLQLSPKSEGLGIYDIAFESCEVPH
ncbi:MAG TPA: redoxin family protein [Candidatus Babeliales bacterium]|nr:redoxin family protein [Candidatus Babeliales bacterium]